MVRLRHLFLSVLSFGLVVAAMPFTASAAEVSVPESAKSPRAFAILADEEAGTYESPDYGYSLTWDDTWQADEPTAIGGRDFLRLRQDGVKAELIGENWDPSSGTCFDAVAREYDTDPPYSQVVETVHDTSTESVTTGSIAFDYTSQSDSTTTNYVIEVLCAPVPGNPTAVVTLKQTILASDLEAHTEAIVGLQDGFSLTGESTQPGESTPASSTITPTSEPLTVLQSPTPTPPEPTLTPVPPTPSPTPQAALAPNQYVSPTYGYSLNYDDSWQVTEELSGNGLDKLSLDNGTVVANLYGETWDPANGNCIDWNVAFYASLDIYSNVEVVESSTSENGLSTALVTLTYFGDGGAIPVTLHLQCSPLPSNPNVLATLEILVFSESDAAQSQAIELLESGLNLTGEN